MHRLAFNDSFAHAGLDWMWSPDLYRQLLAVTGGKERIRHYVESNGKASLDATATAALHACKTERYAERIGSGGVALRPGIARIIGEAREAGIPIAIATTTQPAQHREPPRCDAGAGFDRLVRGSRRRRHGRGQEAGP